MLVTTTAGFFVPVLNRGLIGLACKGVLFAVDLFLMAMLVLPSKARTATRGEGEEEAESSGTPGPLEGKGFHETEWEGYGKAFRWFSDGYVSVIRKTFSAGCAGFYLKNSQGGLRIHAADGADVDPETQDEGGNPVHHVLLQKAPYMAGRLPSGSFLLGMPAQEISSFLGVPLQWAGKIIGVLALGSETENDFSEEDRGVLVHYGDLLTRIMAAYHRGLILETDYEIIKTQFDLESGLKAAEEEDGAIRVFVEQMAKLFPFDRFTVCLADGNEGLIRFVRGQMDQQKPGMRFPLDEGLAGWVIKRKVPLLIPDILQGEYPRPRYLKTESTAHGLRSFLGVPLGRDERFKGCLIMESRHAGQYNDKIKDVFHQLTDQLDYALDRIAWMRRVQGHPSHTPNQGTSQFEME
jgi:transcriptional regulator with GAF, ATPase, and Fis domain